MPNKNELDETIRMEPESVELLPHDPFRICPKCNTIRGPQTAMGIRYCPGSDPSIPYQKDRCRSGVEPQHFHRWCLTCGYAWVEETLAIGTLPTTNEQGWLPYDTSTPCRQCGLMPVSMMQPQVKWCKGGKNCVVGLDPDHMHRSCMQCGYTWVEACLNQELMIGVSEEEVWANAEGKERE
jgi:ribosomal protein L32